MAKSETIQARINPEVKRQAQEILDQLHITMSEFQISRTLMPSAEVFCYTFLSYSFSLIDSFSIPASE
jgi:hypothetical protein